MFHRFWQATYYVGFFLFAFGFCFFVYLLYVLPNNSDEMDNHRFLRTIQLWMSGIGLIALILGSVMKNRYTAQQEVQSAKDVTNGNQASSLR